MSDELEPNQGEMAVGKGQSAWGVLAPVPGEALLPLGSSIRPVISGMAGNSYRGHSLMTRKKEKLEMPVCARVSVSKFRTLEIWCDNSFRKRSEAVGIVLERVLEILEQQGSLEQPVEEFVRRLRVDSSA